MTFDQAAAFFLFAVVAAITPGPSNTMIVATGSAWGLWRGLPCAFGSSVGMGLLLFASASASVRSSLPSPCCSRF
ncbi:MAG: hypothetical protein HC869_25890 [Rhodospirillales bacterium]|nr:hypothetical protein [Rhodospirillales bacterium]